MTRSKPTKSRAKKSRLEGTKKKAGMVRAKSSGSRERKPKGENRKTLVRHGNSLALVIDKQILNQLALDETTPLRVSVAGSGIRIERADAGLGAERTRELLNDLRQDKDFLQMMKDLAK
jgi:antitoxin component of MazEF toxin-antitoxin module